MPDNRELLTELQETIATGKKQLGTENLDIVEELLKDRAADTSLR